VTLHPDIERLACLGWRLYPASRTSRAACFEDAADLATNDLDQLKRWSREFPNCSWRVVMEGSGIWALDLDVPSPAHAHDGVAALKGLVAEHGPVPPRPTIRTGGGGLVLFFKHDGEPITGKTGTPCLGIDPRRGRLTVTVPPSQHIRTALAYRWIIPPWDLAPPPAPGWLLRLVAPPAREPLPPSRPLPDSSDRRRRYAIGALRHAAERAAAAPSGQRNHSLNHETYSLCRQFVPDGLLTSQEIADVMTHAGNHAGLDRREIEQTLTSALKAGCRG
jgi:bifunctional DNA primase/polymerase-like protein